jgi:ATP-dependent Clp protease ATP-binding subunit ClpB
MDEDRNSGGYAHGADMWRDHAARYGVITARIICRRYLDMQKRAAEQSEREFCGQLTEAIRRKPYSVVLFDEIEKAHPDVFNVLLQVLDDGRLTDNKGRTVNFKNTIIIMTSNIGSQLIRERFENINETNRNEIIENTRGEVFELLKQTIRPEFLNRIDELIMFTPLTEKEIEEVVKLQINALTKQLAANGIKFSVTPEAITFLAQEGYDPQFGARPVKRVIQRMVLNELSKQIIAGNVNAKNTILITVNKGELVFENY